MTGGYDTKSATCRTLEVTCLGFRRSNVALLGRNGTVPVQGGRRSFFVFAVNRCPWHSARTCDDVNRAQQGDMTPTSSQISERRKLAAIGVKAGKSQRLIAQKLTVTETTTRRDLEALGITRNKKPAATRRKPDVVFKGSSPATPDGKV